MTKKTILSWSSGKDSAWALHTLRQMPEIELVGLLTSFNESADRVAMHAVRRKLCRAQAKAVGLPLIEIDLPAPCSNEVYLERMLKGVGEMKNLGVTHCAFGDLFLEDVREYRVKMLGGTGIEPLFPIWKKPTGQLARTMIESGLKATITCIDPKQIDPKFAGRDFDAQLLQDLPETADPCGEKGEFHTFVHAGPMFGNDIDIVKGETIERDGFWFSDIDFA
ncbi:adenine nucleotide alpha hydrolase [Planctomycetota bacterium]|nr:adenine nucleotide alpha hydrolase [Planctomycetota bacterium]